MWNSATAARSVWPIGEQTSPSRRTFRCADCGVVLGSVPELRQHQSNNPIPCNLCRIICFSLCALRQHQIGNQPVQCGYCKTNFANAPLLCEHLSKNKHRCEPCKRHFPKSYGLKLHCDSNGHRIAIGEDPLVGGTCPRCGRGFSRDSDLRRHQNKVNCGGQSSSNSSPNTIHSPSSTHSPSSVYSPNSVTSPNLANVPCLEHSPNSTVALNSESSRPQKRVKYDTAWVKAPAHEPDRGVVAGLPTSNSSAMAAAFTSVTSLPSTDTHGSYNWSPVSNEAWAIPATMEDTIFDMNIVTNDEFLESQRPLGVPAESAYEMTTSPLDENMFVYEHMHTPPFTMHDPSAEYRPQHELSRLNNWHQTHLSAGADEFSFDDYVNLDSPTVEAIPPSRDYRAIGAKPPPKCPFCMESLPGDAIEAIQHLGGHHNSDGKHTCTICRIDFLTADILRYHQNCSRDKNCGFKFRHSNGPCTGHHPPLEHAASEAQFSDHDQLQMWCLYAYPRLRNHPMSYLTYVRTSPLSPPQASSWRWSFNEMKRLSLASSLGALSLSQHSEPAVDGSGTLWSSRSPILEIRRRVSLPLTSLVKQLGTLRSITEFGEGSNAARKRQLADQLFRACQEGDISVVEGCIKAGVDVNQSPAPDADPPLIVAAVRGHGRIVECLINAGADVDSCAKNGETALAKAVSEDRPVVVSLLMKKGARVENASGKKSAMHLALLRGCTEVIVAILRDIDFTALPAALREACDFYRSLLLSYHAQQLIKELTSIATFLASLGTLSGVENAGKQKLSAAISHIESLQTARGNRTRRRVSQQQLIAASRL